MKFNIAAAVFAVAVTGAQPASAAGLFGPRGPGAVEFRADGSDPVGVLTASDLRELNGATRVVVSQFTVEFVELSQGLAKTKRDNITVDYAVAPAPDADRQALVDRLYARWIAGLKGQGIEVVGLEAARRSQAWSAKIAGSARPTPELIKTELGRNRVFAPGGLPAYNAPGDTHVGGFSAMGQVGVAMGQFALAKELGAAVMDVRFVVGLRDTGKPTRLFASVRGGDAMIGHPKFSIQALGSEVSIVPPASNTRRAIVRVKDDLLFREDLMEGRMQMANGAAGTAGNIAARAMFLGGLVVGGPGLVQHHTVACTPEQAAYLAAVERNVAATQDLFLAQLKPSWGATTGRPAPVTADLRTGGG